MNRSPDRLYDLLPVVHRMRDADRGYPLRALLRVIAEQVDVVEDDIAQLYENWFIETCEDWVVPYIGDLIGYRPVHEAASRARSALRRAGRSDKILIPRREVAEHARASAGARARWRCSSSWPRRGAAGRRARWSSTRCSAGRSTSIISGSSRGAHGGPARRRRARSARRAVRSQPRTRSTCGASSRIARRGATTSRASACSSGGCRPYSVTPHAGLLSREEGAALLHLQRARQRHAALHQAGAGGRADAHRRASSTCRCRSAGARWKSGWRLRPLRTRASAAYYGAGKSLAIYGPGLARQGRARSRSRATRCIPADLTDWHYRAARGQVAVDPVLGPDRVPRRASCPKRACGSRTTTPSAPTWAAASTTASLSQPRRAHALPCDQGYAGRARPSRPSPRRSQRWEQREALGGSRRPGPDQWLRKERLRAAVVEIADSGVYSEPLTIELAAGESLQIRAANRTRPVIRLLDYMTERPDAFSVSRRAGKPLHARRPARHRARHADQRARPHDDGDGRCTAICAT